MILKKPMKINTKYKNASNNKDAIKLLVDASSELTKLADKAENIKKKIGYGY